MFPYRAGADANMRGEQGAEEFCTVGKGVLAAATFQVFMDGHEGSEPESGVDHSQDKGMGLGLGLSVGAGYGTFEAKFRGQPAEPDDGYFGGIFAKEDIDAASETAESSHFRIHFIIKFGNGVWFREWRADCRREGSPDFFSFPLNSSHFQPLRWIGRYRCQDRVGGGLGAVGRGAVIGHGMPWGLSGGLDLVWV